MDTSTVRMCYYLCYVVPNMSHKKNLTDYSHFLSFRPRNVESLMSVPRLRAKHPLLTQLLHRGIQLISIIYHHCPKLDYTGISDMENILCNIFLILSEILYDQFRVRNTPIKELVLPAQCIASTRDFCHADIELNKILLMLITGCQLKPFKPFF